MAFSLRKTTTILVLIATLAVAASDLSYLVKKKCPKGGQENAPCYAALLTDIVKGVSKGVPELNFKTMDPMQSGPLNLTVNAGSDQFKMNFLAPQFTGLSTARVSKLKVGNPMELTLHIPVVVMTSNYVNSGKLIVIKASGGGAMTNTFEDVSLSMRINYSVKESASGEQKVEVENLDVNFVPKKSKMQVDRLNSGNSVARQLYNIFLSASGSEILGLMSTQLNENFGGILKTTADFIVANLPVTAALE
ncbi:uncharacterized protein LOC132200716 [Neocloeon triangulifer]|uniref:uncharacterized protein LOC132200716 n=1 Tax=Neocloeon triangulifer TaxID=2078957 RepID=UPI00286EC5BF|nr:uncharacterized protein LOC132200716 [Neocloeon triangulifer]